MANVRVEIIKVLEEDEGFADVMFLKLADITSEIYDREAAKTFALEHWAYLNTRTRALYDHVYGRESRLPGYLARNIMDANDIEEKILAQQERADDV